MAHRGRILIVDDESNARAALSEILREDGYATETAADGFKALGKLDEFAPDVILTDLKMPGLDGIAFMEKARAAAPGAVFVVMTAFGTISSAVDAMKKGAENYLLKPLDPEALGAVVDRAMEKARLVQEARRLRDRLRERNALQSHRVERPQDAGGPRARGPGRVRARRACSSRARAERARSSSRRRSTRPARAPRPRSCASTARPSRESLLESELFGHERGAFTGAFSRREGRFKQADGGTLFLDEIGEMPAAVQVKLLRFLQEKTFERVGGNETLRVDVRVIAATNRDLGAEIEKGAFREDLFYRLNVVAVEIPALRERRGDVPALASFFLRRYAAENGKTIETFADDALAALLEYRWPGNVRELENVVERAVVLCDGHRIEKKHLSPTVVPTGERRGAARPSLARRSPISSATRS